MKKLLLFVLLLFSFATLLAAPRMKFQDARNYCSDLGGRLPTAGEMQQLCDQSTYGSSYWTVDGNFFDIYLCQSFKVKKDIERFQYAICVKK